MKSLAVETALPTTLGRTPQNRSLPLVVVSVPGRDWSRAGQSFRPKSGGRDGWVVLRGMGGRFSAAELSFSRSSLETDGSQGASTSALANNRQDLILLHADHTYDDIALIIRREQKSGICAIQPCTVQISSLTLSKSVLNSFWMV